MIDNASKPRLVLEQHEAAFVLRISENDVRNRLRRGALKGTRLGRRMCVDADDVAARVAAALIDRLVHHAHIITLKGKSYRLRDRGTQPAPAAAVIQPAGLRPTT